MTREQEARGPDTATATLEDELEQFRAEKEKIRRLVGQIGGVASNRRDRVINVAFIFALALLLVIDMLRHILGLAVPFPPLFSIELGVLLVSIKIIWMIHKQTRVEHFQFWILNSIEFRLNEVSKQMRQIEKRFEETPGSGS